MPSYLLPLTERREIAEGTMLFRFALEGASFPFRAGQYADFTLEAPEALDAQGNTRSFSLASSPNTKDFIEIATRVPNGGPLTAFKRALRDAPLGAKVRVSLPLGSFTLHGNAGRPGIFVAGGIGITPVISMLRHAAEEGLSHRLILLYTGRTQASMPFLEELTALAEQNPRLTVFPTATRASGASAPSGTGRIDEVFVRARVPEEIISRAVWYVVGAPAMVSEMASFLPRIGADPDSIRTEEFAGY